MAIYTIIKSTEKAHLIEDTNTEKRAWVQKRYIRKDGSLTPSAIKELTEGKTIEQFTKEKKEERDFENRLIPALVVKETEKAIMVQGTHEFGCDVHRSVNLWVPKSLLKEGMIPFWFLKKKCIEVISSFNRGGWVEYHNEFIRI